MSGLMLGMYKFLQFISNPIGYALDISDKILEPDAVKNFNDVANAITLIVKKILGPIFSIVGVAMVILTIRIGFDYAKSQDASEREKNKGKLIGMIVGCVIMVAGAVLCFAINWAHVYANWHEDGKQLHYYTDSTYDDDELCDFCGQVKPHVLHKRS